MAAGDRHGSDSAAQLATDKHKDVDAPIRVLYDCPAHLSRPNSWPALETVALAGHFIDFCHRLDETTIRRRRLTSLPMMTASVFAISS